MSRPHRNYETNPSIHHSFNHSRTRVRHFDSAAWLLLGRYANVLDPL